MFLGAIISPFQVLLAISFAYLSAISFPKIPEWLFILTILTVIESSWSLCLISLNLVKMSGRLLNCILSTDRNT